MGEILVYAGRPEEAEAWVRKAMRLNPYHPEAYWFHLGRALFHTGREAEALEALRNITRPKPRDLAYRVAAAERAGDPAELEQTVTALRSARPGFEAGEFVGDLPNEREQDSAALLEALRAAGL